MNVLLEKVRLWKENSRARLLFWLFPAGVSPDPLGRTERMLRMHSRDLYSEVALVVPAHSAIQWVVSHLFDYQREVNHQIEIVTQSEWLRDQATRLLAPPWRSALLGFQVDDLTDFLRARLGGLITRGESFTRIFWKSEESESGDSLLVIERLTGLRRSGVRVKQRAGQPSHFVVDPRKAHWWQGGQEEHRYSLGRDEMLYLRWPWPTSSRAKVPLSDCVRPYWDHVIAMQATVARQYAAANPDDHSWRVELARHSEASNWLDRSLWGGIRVRERIGQSLLYVQTGWAALVPPLTEYFLVWQHLESHKRICQLRDYLLGEFSKQVLRAIARRNNLNESIQLRPVGFLTEQEIDNLFLQYQRGEVSRHEVFEATELRSW